MGPCLSDQERSDPLTSTSSPRVSLKRRPRASLNRLTTVKTLLRSRLGDSGERKAVLREPRNFPKSDGKRSRVRLLRLGGKRMTDTIKADEFIEFSLSGCCDGLGKYLKGDVLLIDSPMFSGLDDAIRVEIEKLNPKAPREPRLIVVLETSGGFIEVVERICNVFRKHYREVDFIIPNHVYSAGTVLRAYPLDTHTHYI